MKQVSTGYKNQIKEMGREIDSIITYYNHYRILTEDNKYIITEGGKKILTDHVNYESYQNILADDIFSCKIITHGNLMKTIMQEFDFEIRQDISIGSIVGYKFGVKVNGDYEYVDYGKFIVREKEYNEDTQTYSYKSYDEMLLSMVPFKKREEYIFEFPFKMEYLVNFIAMEIGLNSTYSGTFPNSETMFTREMYRRIVNGNYTYRDVLDFICEISGCTISIRNSSITVKEPMETSLTLDEYSFKDTNVKFNKVFGPINSIVFSRSEDTDLIEIKDDSSIEQYGVTQIKIKDNPFLEDDDRNTFQQELLESLDGLTYTINDLSTIGITYLEFYDKFDIQIGNNTYPCLLLNDEITIQQGLEEMIFTEEPEEKEQEYATSSLSDKEQKWADLKVKKDLANIYLEVGTKVGEDEIISKINLSPEEAEILSNKISLKGKTINLTSDTIDIVSSNFNVDSNGIMSCTGATFTGGDINLVSVGQNSKFTITDSQNSNASWSQSARKITWNGLNGGLLEMTNYLPGGGTIVCKSDDNTQSSMTAYEVKAPTITPTSKEELKKNFEKFDNALELVKNVDIYKYNLKFEKDSDKKHIGLVIGDKYKYSKDITNKENDGVDLYSMISVLWQAVKEQQKEIEELKERIGK